MYHEMGMNSSYPYAPTRSLNPATAEGQYCQPEARKSSPTDVRATGNAGCASAASTSAASRATCRDRAPWTMRLLLSEEAVFNESGAPRSTRVLSEHKLSTLSGLSQGVRGGRD
jgi:hypothetical protein